MVLVLVSVFFIISKEVYLGDSGELILLEVIILLMLVLMISIRTKEGEVDVVDVVVVKV